MEQCTLNNLVDKAYRGAKQNGFYCDIQDPINFVAAIHEELSEAFRCWNKHQGWLTFEPKPDGVYFELTDAVIRMLSYCGHMGIELDMYDIDTDRPYTQSDLIDVILRSHQELSQYYDLINTEYDEDDFRQDIRDNLISGIMSRFIARIELFIAQASEGTLDLQQLIEHKMNYNATRSRKHGGNEV